MDEQKKQEQSEDVEAHIRPHHLREDEGSQDEHEHRPNAHRNDGDEDVEAHSMGDPEHRYGPGHRYEPGKRY